MSKQATGETRNPHDIVADCWTCACDGPPTCPLPHEPDSQHRMPYRLTETRRALHVGHDVREISR